MRGAWASVASLRSRLRTWNAALRGRTDPIILMYHRVARLRCDPWKLAVTPEHFAEQIAVLAQRRTILPLERLVAELEAGRVPDRVVAITFDDGYADVLLHAKPILERFAAPATAYLTTGALGRRTELWWDTLSRLVLEAPFLPASLEVDVGGRPRAFATHDRPAAHLAIWTALRPLADDERSAALAALARTLGAAGPLVPARPDDRALDPDEVHALAAGGLVTIGAHTVTHPSLPMLDPDTQRREMAESRATCERLLGTPVTAFAYPFGDHDRTSVALARAAGFRHACTTEPGVAASARDRFRLPRVFVDDWSGADFARRVLGTS